MKIKDYVMYTHKITQKEIQKETQKVHKINQSIIPRFWIIK